MAAHVRSPFLAASSSTQRRGMLLPATRRIPAAAAAAAPPRQRTRSGRSRTVPCAAAHRFVLYTKPDCPLCDGLKDKVNALIDRAAFMPSALSGASLEVRDISTNPEWQDEMHLSVPVLAAINAQGEEVVLPRPQPRVTADRLEKHLEAGLKEAGLM